MTRLLTNDELLAVDKLYWDILAMITLYRTWTGYNAKLMSNHAWIARTQTRLTGAVAVLDGIDEKNIRALKDAQTEVDNCTKLLTRLALENEDLLAKHNSTKAQHAAIYARVAEHDFHGPVATRCRERYNGACIFAC